MLQGQYLFPFIHETPSGDAGPQKRQVRSHAAKNPLALRKQVAKYQEEQPAVDTQRCTLNVAAEPGQVGTDIYFLGMPKSDPFQSFVRPLSRVEWFLLDHFISHLVPISMHCFADSDENDGPYQKSMLSCWFQTAARDAGFISCVMLTACRDLSRCAYAGGGPGMYAAMAAQHSFEAIGSLRESLVNQDTMASDNSMLKAMSLGLDAAVTGDFEALFAHAAALRKMVELRGGLSALGLSGSLRKLSVWNLNGPQSNPQALRYLSCIMNVRRPYQVCEQPPEVGSP